MLTMLPLALAALAAIPQSDTTFAVSPKARLDVRDHEGTITITAWNRNDVRVRASLGRRERIEVSNTGAVVRIEARRERGGPASVDFDITVPASMALSLNGLSADISVDGVTGDVTAQSVEGDITVRHGGGSATLSSVEGDVILDGARGRVQVNGTDGGIRISNVVGDISAETIDGDITLDGIDAANVDASTVDGDVSYRGTVKDGGSYHLSSHSGDVTLSVGSQVNATVSVSTFDGSFDAAFPVQLTQSRPGKRFTFVLGNGSARVELESFDGTIRLDRRP